MKPEAGEKYTIGQVGIHAEIAVNSPFRPHFVPLPEALGRPVKRLEKVNPGAEKKGGKIGDGPKECA
jgi:hypothetical protein